MLLKIAMCICLLMTTNLSHSMEFRLFKQPELNRNVVIAEGIIKEGDAIKLKSILEKGDKDKDGFITLVLNSLGGSVKASFEMVEVMDEHKILAIVPQNALCASACASILFVSAEKHIVVGNGKLGFHTCYKTTSKYSEPSSICNELVAENAMSRGTSYASVALFNEDYGPDEMAWLDKEVACMIGLCRP